MVSTTRYSGIQLSKMNKSTAVYRKKSKLLGEDGKIKEYTASKVVFHYKHVRAWISVPLKTTQKQNKIELMALSNLDVNVYKEYERKMIALQCQYLTTVCVCV